MVRVRVVLLSLLFGLSPAVAPAQQPLTVVAAVSADPGHLNPAITTGSPTHAVADSLFNGLLALDAKGEPRPDLAVRWSLSEDGLRARFDLAKEARWHDGQPVTADDVKFTFESVLLRHHARTRASLGPVLDGIDAIDAGPSSSASSVPTRRCCSNSTSPRRRSCRATSTAPATSSRTRRISSRSVRGRFASKATPRTIAS